MDFREYQKKAYVAIQPHSSAKEEAMHWMIGLAEEVGEVASIIKHTYYGSEPTTQEVLAKEVGDVLWHLAALCQVYGLDLEGVAKLNLAKLQHRFPENEFTNERSLSRHELEKDFEETEEYLQCLKELILKKRGKVVILAGNECTGKSTCFSMLQNCSELREALFEKESYTNSLAEKKTRVAQIKFYNSTDNLVIYDRATILDDLIYTLVMSGAESVLPNVIEDFVAILRECQIVYFDCSLDVIKERLRKRGDEYISEEQLEDISNVYEEIFKRYSLDICRVDVNSLSKEEVVKKVLEVVLNE